MSEMLYVSASSIADFKACATRWFNHDFLGIRRIEDTDSQRVGTNWHKILEIASLKPGSVCGPCAQKAKNDPDCPLCAGTGFLPDDILDAVIRELDRAYKNIPASVSLGDAEIERITLLYSLIGYRWLYSDKESEQVLCRESEFELPLINPTSGRALPDVRLRGKIDKVVVLPNGDLAIKEHKSTSKGVDQDSPYWGHLNLDTQTTMYLYAARRMQENGGIDNSKPISTILYDVWHKPGISPKKLTQGDSKKFVEGGEYCGQKFEVHPVCNSDNTGFFTVNGQHAEAEPGAKEGTFAIKETPEMFGARLLQDITQRPEFYFARRQIIRTDKEMQQFEWELLHIYRAMRGICKAGCPYHNEQQCEATFRCDYMPFCYNGIVLGKENVPDGFKIRKEDN
jgi:hypothetical protein